mgnify:FL=1|jgi:hypothetical protein|tara:strand:+ start:1122 stop:1997 length:876 start_codon:yes stop_codon:yes gene_type:complete
MNVDITPTDGFPHMYDYVNNAAGVGSNPIVLIILTFVIVFYYILFSYLGISESGSSAPVSVQGNAGLKLIEIFMWGLFIFLILINGLQYFFNIDIKTGIKNIFTPVPEVDITVTTPEFTEDTSNPDASNAVPEITTEPQVFHVSDNKYKFNNAKAVCKAYGARLASIEEIQKAHDGGAEWCGYGWSQDQLALYPTQTKTWKHLQTIKGHEHDCGRPGINGGFIGNPNAKFGANCFGYKPKITDTEKKLMENETLFPETAAERKFNKKVKRYKNKLPDILVSPFNYDKWSQI